MFATIQLIASVIRSRRNLRYSLWAPLRWHFPLSIQYYIFHLGRVRRNVWFYFRRFCTIVTWKVDEDLLGNSHLLFSVMAGNLWTRTNYREFRLRINLTVAGFVIFFHCSCYLNVRLGAMSLLIIHITYLIPLNLEL